MIWFLAAIEVVELKHWNDKFETSSKVGDESLRFSFLEAEFICFFVTQPFDGFQKRCNFGFKAPAVIVDFILSHLFSRKNQQD